MPILAAYVEINAASDAVVVEGVGGFRVPLNDEFDTSDLAEQLSLPEMVRVVLEARTLLQHYQNEKEGADRIENLEQMVSAEIGRAHV